ncbi:hypothetical protein LRP52_35910 [Photobacterium sp. ZSDE20]|uniref:Uncharacterized protein n=1 Tax=Photobacterium pectinilyticum TaxID=2906793 RepID=A0ABT1N5V4_9GAMM|nr:hypothetical protein [Photobacterium sp. ZSDE20]MCQ1060115.1 hypothetical protein [Photobacterium sp. ZSDE20]MDD1827571.1 hypothetical protein [Photobacterium sp. ZSDE20]
MTEYEIAQEIKNKGYHTRKRFNRDLNQVMDLGNAYLFNDERGLRQGSLQASWFLLSKDNIVWYIEVHQRQQGLFADAYMIDSGIYKSYVLLFHEEYSACINQLASWQGSGV